MPGIELKAVGLWVPKWDDGAGCEWSKEGEFWGIHVRYFPNGLDSKDKLANIDDLKSAAPMMTEIGTAVTKVIRPSKKTANGWYTVVESNEGQSQNFIYVQGLGSKTLVCSATVKSANDMGGGSGHAGSIALASALCAARPMTASATPPASSPPPSATHRAAPRSGASPARSAVASCTSEPTYA